LRLELRRAVPRDRETFVAGPSNAEALEMIDAWPRWHGGALALVGPAGSGKSHLASVWRERAGAAMLDRRRPELALAAAGPVLVEDVDQGADAEALFHLINMAARTGGGLLLTARTPPATWPSPIPDLRSRLNALPAAMIEAPDDRVLEGVLRRFFAERSIRPPEELISYLIARMERSVDAARALVERLDDAADGQKPITRVLARQILEDEGESPDLFDG
jgi:chromosomal replication initiation ATPase DnaA